MTRTRTVGEVSALAGVAARTLHHYDELGLVSPSAPEMHRELGEMYVSDERFARGYEREAEGLADDVRRATAANAHAKEVATR